MNEIDRYFLPDKILPSRFLPPAHDQDDIAQETEKDSVAFYILSGSSSVKKLKVEREVVFLRVPQVGWELSFSDDAKDNEEVDTVVMDMETGALSVWVKDDTVLDNSTTYSDSERLAYLEKQQRYWESQGWEVTQEEEQ